MKAKKSVTLRVLLVTLFAIGLLVLCVFVKGSSQRPELNVIEKTDLAFNIEIDQNDTSFYKNFIKNNVRYQTPISKIELLKQIKDAQDYLETHPSGKITGDLRKRIITELNVGFLLHKLNQRKLVVTVAATHQYEGYTENELLFKDPQVGTFSVLFLVPNKEKRSHPAVVGLHGHGDSSKRFRDNYFGKELAKKGFIVIMPSFRAMFCDEIERVISEELYLSGFTLMGLRVYETLLTIKYLKHKNFVDKIGIMGHSGGSDTAYLVSIISPDLQALVYDMYPNQLNMCYERIHCETIPRLAYYGSQINDFATLKIPSRKFEYSEYGYSNPGDAQKVTTFFKEKLELTKE